MKLNNGSRILVPKVFEFNRHVAGQSSGWEAGWYGIPDDIASQVDRVPLWALVCTGEALNMSGTIETDLNTQPSRPHVVFSLIFKEVRRLEPPPSSITFSTFPR